MLKFVKNLSKEKKIIFILVFFLIILLGVMQTSLSFKTIKIRNLEDQVQQLNLQNSKSNASVKETEDFDLNDDLSLNNEIEDSNISDIKDKFIAAAKKINKKYDEKLNGREVIKFEIMDLNSITDSQIEKTVEKLKKDNFNINIIENELSNRTYYQIILIE